MVGTYWRFLGEALAPDTSDILRQIPGVKVSREQVAAPRNAAWIVEALLSATGARFRVVPPPSFEPRNASRALPHLRPWVPAFLTPYQREGLAALLAMPGESGHAWWSAGSGKTLLAIVWSLVDPGLTLVVTKAAIRSQWAREVSTYTTVRATVIDSVDTRDFDPQLAAVTPHFLILGYEILPAWAKLLERLRPRSVVFDESHKVKSHKRWDAEVEDGAPGGPPRVSFELKDNVAAAAYVLSRATRRRLSTTATPISDRVRDLWSQLDLVHPWEWGGFYDFARRYCAATENLHGGMETRGAANLDELKRRTDFVTHRVPRSVAMRDLPPKRRIVTYLAVRDQARAEAIADDMRAAMKAARSRPESRARVLEVRLWEAASRKRNWVRSTVVDALEGGSKVVVFTGRRRDALTLTDMIGRATTHVVPLQILRGTGEDSLAVRDAVVQSYMDAKGPAVLIGTGDAFGEGLNLQDTDVAIFAMLPYTPRQIIQWEGRFARLGQRRPVLIRYPICESTVDEWLTGILISKLPQVEEVTATGEVPSLTEELLGTTDDDLLNSLLDKVLSGGEQAEA